MTSPEYEEYEILTKGLEFEFRALTFDFLQHCENIISGSEYTDLRYFCYHFYNNAYFKSEYERFVSTIETIFTKIDKDLYPELNNGFSNLLIYLREPKARENDKEYKNANIKYWRDMVASDEVLRGNGGFRKYLIL